MADVDPGCPAYVFYDICGTAFHCEPDFAGDSPGKGYANLPRGDPFGGFYHSILIDCEREWPDEGDGVARVTGHKAIGLGMHISQDQLIGRWFADNREVYAMYIYGIVMHTIEAAAIDRYKTFTAGEVHAVRKRRDHPAAAGRGFDEDFVHRNILRELGDDAQAMHIVHADILPLYILTVDQEGADLIADGIPDGEDITYGKAGMIEVTGEVQHAGRGFGCHRMK
jgi:hypothetical protein